MNKWDKEAIFMRLGAIVFLLVMFIPALWLFWNNYNFLAFCWLALMVMVITYEFWFPIVFLVVISVYVRIQIALEDKIDGEKSYSESQY